MTEAFGTTDGSNPLRRSNETTEETVWTEAHLSEERISELIVGITPAEADRDGRDFGVHIFDGSDPRSDIGRRAEWQVFDEFFGNNIDVMREEYEPYDPHSTFIVVVDYQHQRPMGVVRMVTPSPVGLKSMNDLLNPDQKEWCREADSLASRMAEIGARPDQLADVATIAVAPEYRTGHSEVGTSAVLYSSYVQWSLENGFNYSIIILDKNIFNMIQSWGSPLKTFEGAGWATYLESSASIPVHLELGEGLDKVAAFDEVHRAQGADVDIHGLYTRGKGLEGQFILPKFDVPVQYLR